MFFARQLLTRIAAAAFIDGSLAENIGLTQALIWTIPFPRLICAAVRNLFYWSYPRNSARQRTMMAQRARELAA